MDSRRVEIARTGDYTVLVLFSVGTSKGKWGSLLENLFEFKRLYDSEAPLEEALPELVAKYPHRYRNVTLKELSDAMSDASSVLKSDCPTYRPLTPIGRLEAMEQRLNAMSRAVTTVQPALERFYGTLSDEQKERFNRLGPAQS